MTNEPIFRPTEPPCYVVIDIESAVIDETGHKRYQTMEQVARDLNAARNGELTVGVPATHTGQAEVGGTHRRGAVQTDAGAARKAPGVGHLASGVGRRSWGATLAAARRGRLTATTCGGVAGTLAATGAVSPRRSLTFLTFAPTFRNVCRTFSACIRCPQVKI